MRNFFRNLSEKILTILFPYSGNVKEISLLIDKNELSTLPPPEEEPLSKTSSLFSYKNELVRTLVWQIKYKRNKKCIDAVGTLLYELILADISDEVLFSKDAFLLVPIPIGPKRRKERGFNQTEEIAQAIIKMDSQKTLEYSPNILLKTKETLPQTKTKSKKERLENTIGSFLLSKHSNIQNKKIILIDDVITTGSTLREAKRVLRENGAKEIYAYTIAH